MILSALCSDLCSTSLTYPPPPLAYCVSLTWWFSSCLPSSLAFFFVLLRSPPGDWPTGWKWARSRIQNPLKSLSVSLCFPGFLCIFLHYFRVTLSLPAASLTISSPLNDSVLSHCHLRTIISPLDKCSDVFIDIYWPFLAGNWHSQRH